MFKVGILSMIENLEKAKGNYMAAIAALEDISFDDETKKKACNIIQDTQIHESIALEEIQG
ncbi:hypothetical protein CI105_08595 [Candidatus Izimaplasma bacterium ZiA1]|uniref:hypothetical protein n=1 Tax=Candidatus Izimoplasma sp. ZiA1 TaxID=2024899 RepID=UPI000BAA951B|nr:hypothetical protein CI105_08595 [Candidatus Izimaplasma bacterium ZiA1]